MTEHYAKKDVNFEHLFSLEKACLSLYLEIKIILLYSCILNVMPVHHDIEENIHQIEPLIITWIRLVELKKKYLIDLKDLIDLLKKN